MERSTENSHTHSVLVMVLLALCFLATQSFENTVGDKTGIKQSSVTNSLALFPLDRLKNTIKHTYLPTKLEMERCHYFSCC